MKNNDFSILLTSFLSKYLPGQRNLSNNTIISYRDNFKLFLTYCLNVKKIRIETIQLHDINRKTVLDFLEWIETKRSCGISTRNQRLAAFKSFFHYVAAEVPDYLFQCQQIASIPIKRSAGRETHYFSPEGMNKLLLQPDTRTWKGRRDHALLSLLYDSAARVQELVDLKIGDIRLEDPMVVNISGKGRKLRTVPLCSITADIVRGYITELNKRTYCNLNSPLFQNSRKSKLTRAGVAGILKKYLDKMVVNNLSLFIPGKVSPHCLRHSKAIHLLRSGVPLIYIRDFLGHASVTTTEIYAKVDSLEKQKAIEMAYPVQSSEKIPVWEKDKDLISWLSDFCT